MIKFNIPSYLLISFGYFVLITSCANQSKTILYQDLVGYWPMNDDAKDQSGNNLQTEIHGSMEFRSSVSSLNNIGSRFNGMDTWLEIKPSQDMHSGDFSISAWINSESGEGLIPGDIISQYDSKQRKGFSLSIKTNMSSTGLSNYRQLTFGIDDNISTEWENCGRPGNALLAFGLVDFKGNLYAGTCEPDIGDAGHVYRYEKDQKWTDCGSPDSSNSVIALTEFKNELYVGTGRYRVAGSSLPESQNNINGGRIFRYEEESGKWVDCGQLPNVECIASLIVYKEELYATSMFSQGFYKYMGGKEWRDCGTPDGKRVQNLGIHNGYLYATSWDWAHVYRYDGEKWEDCGQVGGEENTQTYAFAVYEGDLYVATWRSGRVFRFEGINNWVDVGRLGDELEVMGMVVHNGQLLAGTLPLAEVYIYEGDTAWRRMDQLDRTPDVTYRRAWTMAEHDGKVFCSTLPSGNIYSYEAGKSVTHAEPFPEGWHHVVATKSNDKIQLFVNGNLVDHRSLDAGININSVSDQSVQVGFGPNGLFYGGMRELRMYNRELKKDEIKVLMETR